MAQVRSTIQILRAQVRNQVDLRNLAGDHQRENSRHPQARVTDVLAPIRGDLSSQTLNIITFLDFGLITEVGNSFCLACHIGIKFGLRGPV